MVAIRLSRTGAKKKPSYRVVVTDKRRARDSRNIEIVGHYNPRPDPVEIVLKRERIDYWLGVGAQPSKTVQRLMKGFDERFPPDAEEVAPEEPVAAAETPEPEAETQAAEPAASLPGQPSDNEPDEEWSQEPEIEIPEDMR